MNFNKETKLEILKLINKVFFFIIYFIVVFLFMDMVVFKHFLHQGMICLDRWNANNSRRSIPYAHFINHRILNNTTSFDKNNFYPTDNDAIKVAFFGGSTGEPIDEEYFSYQLSKLMNRYVFVKNFSCSSSNHRQHMHLILEILPKYNPDIIVFYGGYNEIIQPSMYDPRPGYPYNFYYKGETSPFKQFLIENSALIGAIEVKNGTISPYKALVNEYNPGSQKWCNEIFDKYFETLKLSKNISETLKSKHYGKTKFIAFYQPYRYELFDKLKDTHIKIKNEIKKYNYIFDISDAYDSLPKSIYIDDCHVTEESGANQKIVQTMSKIISKQFPVK